MTPRLTVEELAKLKEIAKQLKDFHDIVISSYQGRIDPMIVAEERSDNAWLN